MFKRKFRLSSFSLRSPKQISGSMFNIKIGQNDQDLNRFAFVVSKKIDMRATARNQIKRKVRGGFEKLADSVMVGHDFIVYPKKNTMEATSDQILDEIKDSLAKIDLLK